MFLSSSVVAMNEALKRAEVEGYAVCERAWNDGQRSVTIGPDGEKHLSCWGGNITDATIVAEDGRCLPILRPPNLDEKVSLTTADKIVFAERDGTPVTAQDVLESLGERASYRGVSVDAKVEKGVPHPVVVRVQTVWVPLSSSSLQIVPVHYSYQTTSRSDPRNLIVLGTPSGFFVHTDAPGENRLFAHTIRPDGGVDEHWFTADETNARVGEALLEEDAPRDKARAVEMGVRGMGPRANCFVVLSVPNKQHSPPSDPWDETELPVYRSLGGQGARGESRSARVSIGSVFGTATRSEVPIERAEGEPITVTLLLYNTVRGGDVDPSDLASSVQDMDRIYDLLAAEGGGSVCLLSQVPFMLHNKAFTGAP